MVVPSPRLPRLFAPQHQIEPSLFSPQAWCWAAYILAAVKPPLTCVGTKRSVVVLSPI